MAKKIIIKMPPRYSNKKLNIAYRPINNAKNKSIAIFNRKENVLMIRLILNSPVYSPTRLEYLMDAYFILG